MYSAAISHSSIVARHAALEHHRLAAVADGLQQREVLHVARADLEHVGVLGDELDVGDVDDLGDDRQAGLRAHVGEDLEPALAEPLERVRRGARLERAAAQQGRAGAPWPSAAASSVCSGVSTAHGPAMSVNVSGPIGTRVSPTYTVDLSAWCWRETSLYGVEMRTTSATPGSARRLRPWKRSTSPTRPMIVRVTPRLTNASPPASVTRTMTASISASVAPGLMTMTMCGSLPLGVVQRSGAGTRKAPAGCGAGLLQGWARQVARPTRGTPGRSP